MTDYAQFLVLLDKACVAYTIKKIEHNRGIKVKEWALVIDVDNNDQGIYQIGYGGFVTSMYFNPDTEELITMGAWEHYLDSFNNLNSEDIISD